MSDDPSPHDEVSPSCFYIEQEDNKIHNRKNGFFWQQCMHAGRSVEEEEEEEPPPHPTFPPPPPPTVVALLPTSRVWLFWF